MKKRNATWSAVALLIVGLNLLLALSVAAAGDADETDSTAKVPGLPISCDGGDVVYGTGYAGLGPAVESQAGAIDAFLRGHGYSEDVTAREFVESPVAETGDSTMTGENGVGGAIFLDGTAQAALYLEEVGTGQWRVEASTICDSYLDAYLEERAP